MNNEHCFDRMLTTTTDLFFDLEQELFLHRLAADKPLAVLDVGCGNGAYLSRVSRHYPLWTCTGIEMNEGIFHYAKMKESARLTVHLSPYERFQSGVYDCVIVRLVAAHLEDRGHFMHWLRERTRPGSMVILIDVDEDDAGAAGGNSAELPLFDILYREMRQPLRASKLMLLRDSLALEAGHAGLRTKELRRYKVSAVNAAAKALMVDYMRLVTGFRCGIPLPPERETELREWYERPGVTYDIRMFGLMLEV